MVTREQISKTLKNEQLYAEIGYNSTMVSITIEDGDWKHEHLFLDYLMCKLGLQKVCEQEIGKSDCDCYSSTHYYLNVG